MSLPVYATRGCDCTAPKGVGYKRPEKCEAHGNRFQTERELEPSRRTSSAPRNSEPDRDWSVARTKVEEEGCCRICKRRDRKLDAAHILGREHDEPKLGAGGRILKVLFVHPARIIPACGPYPLHCHGDVDHRKINLLPYLTLEEELQAVIDAGGIAPAQMRLAPVTHREEVEASSVAHLELVDELRARIHELEASIHA